MIHGNKSASGARPWTAPRYLLVARVTSAPCRDSRLRASIPRRVLLHIKLHAIELGHIEVDELAGYTAVVCPKRLACRHVGDNLALDKALLLAFGGRVSTATV